MAKKKVARGRPPKKPGEFRTNSVRLSCTDAEKAALKSRASDAGLTMTEYILRKCLE